MFKLPIPSLPNFHFDLTKVIVFIFVVLTAVIPITVFLLSRNFRTNSAASEKLNINSPPKTSLREVPKTTPLQDLLNNTLSKFSQASPSPSTSEETTDDIPKVAGSNLDLKIQLEGRPTTDQSTKLFVGIAPGDPMIRPQYLLSFTIDIPKSGEYKGLSLAGVVAGSKYTAYLKGPAQIATSSSFLANPSTATLNPTGEALSLSTGDLNEDNIVNDQDLKIAQKALGASSSSINWNPNVDFNLDGIINNFDIGIINKNLNKIGASGEWFSTTGTATSSGKPLGGPLNAPNIKPQGSNQGYWLWFPQF